MEKQKLTKKELKQLRKEQRVAEQEQEIKTKIKWKWFLIGAIAFGVVSVTGLILYKVNQPPKPLPGIAVKDLGQDHVSDIYGVKYASNPPTSGPHFVLWAKKGVYDRVISDGYLIHSLEHGYIVISYNCERLPKPFSWIPKAFAHEDDAVEETGESSVPLMHMDLEEGAGPFTPKNPPAAEVVLPESFSSTACKTLVKNLASFLDAYDRIVIVPRLNLDNLIELTAWRRIEKFSKFDKENMQAFITAFHNKGPEKTME